MSPIDAMAATKDCYSESNTMIAKTLSATSLIKSFDYMRGYHRLYKLWNDDVQKF